MNLSHIDQSLTLEDLAARVDKAERRQGVICGVALLGTIIAFTLGWHKDAVAQGYTMTLAQAAARIIALENRATTIENRATALETKTQDLSRVTDADGQPTVRFTGVNVQVVSGAGATDGTVNGRGNLIVGYNEVVYVPRDHRGSHNLVIGNDHSYSSYGGFLAGCQNNISAPFASVSGGASNTAMAIYSSVSGGAGNWARGAGSSVSGGSGNRAIGEGANVSGGSSNYATGPTSSVSGGENNNASGSSSSVSGGAFNNASGTLSNVSGGSNNQASGFWSSVSGGYGNTASGNYASVSGGQSNQAKGSYSAISGGPSRSISTDSGWVAGRFSGTGYTGHFNSP